MIRPYLVFYKGQWLHLSVLAVGIFTWAVLATERKFGRKSGFSQETSKHHPYPQGGGPKTG